MSYLKSTVDVNFEGLKIVLDGANGSTSSLAPFLFGDLEADTETIGCVLMDIISMRNVALHILKN
ncbi:Phosphoglucosamine mutase / FemD, factor involved in methicillin resistance [Staphylococcus aureus]|uniref:Phosphoglucosamine mutase / FemD, factor involved in methicillin resistance n=1 Tax=Staphylococcus aureus TaxID=1280 RepID=A0A2X2K064_STAAU|nr:Phosphoglucosamine mutase / FemD, factor involved in methicillin resistance [Staphylococcus aureus]